MKKFLISLLIFSFLLPAFAQAASEEQAKSTPEEEKQKNQQEQSDTKEEDTVDYKELNRKTRFETGKARNKGHVSAGYEHVRSKYQANTSLKKYKAEFEERKNFELRLLKLTPYEAPAEDDKNTDNDKEKD